MTKKLIASVLSVALLLSMFSVGAGAAEETAAAKPKKGSDIFLYWADAAIWMDKGFRDTDWSWGYAILYYLLWPGAQLWHLVAPIVLAIAAPIAGSVNDLIYPPIADFVPTPEPDTTVEKKYSIGNYDVVYGAGASVTEIKAAEILADTLSQITGWSFVAEEGVVEGGNQILIGSISGLDISKLGSDGYIIESGIGVNPPPMGPGWGSIRIAGGKRGVIYGVYQFLQKYLDCRWYTSRLIVIPTGLAMITKVESESYVPTLEYREEDWLSRSDVTYSLANGLNGNTYRSIPNSLGGTYGYNGSFAHTIINQFVKPSEFFAGHPDWYAYRESSNARVPKQLCLTNPDVLAEMIREVRAYLGNGSGQPIVSVTQDDNQDYCQCANCKAVDAEEGSQAGTMLRFVNAIAANIAGDYPNAAIDTFAYQYTRTPPKKVRPLPNVIVRLCSIECCFAHPLDDPNCAENVNFANDIKTWSQICGRLYIWDYTTDYGHFNCLFPNFQVLQKNMQFFARNNVKGIYEEGNYTSDQCNSEFAELRGYLLARLLFNPDIDYDAEMNGFLKAYYGGGWQYVREFLDLAATCAGAKKPHRKMGIFNSPTDKDILCMRPNQIDYADRLWAKAIELAGDGIPGTDGESYKQHVLRSQLCWRFWKACNRTAEFSILLPTEAWQNANEWLYTNFREFGITRYSEGWNDTDYKWRFLPEPPADWWGTPETWRG